MATIIGAFQNHDDAENAINLLKANNIAANDIGIVMRDTSTARELANDTGTRAEEAAAAGATFGGVLGGIAGLLIGLGAFVIPGVGPVIAGGAIASALSGAAIGAASGGLLGSLIGLGVPESEARFYDERVRGGSVLVTVNTNDEQGAQVRALLDQAGAVYYQDQSQANIGNAATPSTSGIMGANMEDTLPEPGDTQAQPARTTSTTLPPATVPSGDKPSEFIRSQNDYPTDANDMEVVVPERPDFDRGTDNTPVRTVDTAGMTAPPDEDTSYERPSGVYAMRETAPSGTAPAVENPNATSSQSSTRSTASDEPTPLGAGHSGAGGELMVDRDSYGKRASGSRRDDSAETSESGVPLDSDQKLAKQLGVLDEDRAALRNDTQANQQNPETVARIRESVANDNTNIAEDVSGNVKDRVSDAKDAVADGINKIRGKDDDSSSR